ncbi:hypothetical protein K523DRAFT_339006 [Schizophyllum commune Tattone D]|nr:hypothetical protein K523DRAFT_339006 [Schizophyllum commune Tattone D]
MSFNFEAYNVTLGVHREKGSSSSYESSLRAALIDSRPLPESYRLVPSPMPVLGDVTNRVRTEAQERIIWFDHADGRRGVRLQFLHPHSQSIVKKVVKNADDAVFSMLDRKRITIVIAWPGYENVSFATELDLVTPYGPVTRGIVAHAVSSAMAQFMEKVKNTVGMDPVWKISHNRIQLKDVILLSLWTADTSVWHANFALST